MKKYIAIFSVFFFIFAIAGVNRGFEANRESTNDILPLVLKDATLSIGPENSRVELVFHCEEDGAIYAFNVQRHTVRSANPTLSHLKPPPGTHSIPIEGTLVKSFLGGASAWTVKDLVDYIREGGAKGESNRAKEALAAVLGGVSGYAAGYWGARLLGPECDSPLYIKSLTDKEKWKAIEGYLWFDHYASNRRAILANIKNGMEPRRRL